jgi:hypothetical protein
VVSCLARLSRTFRVTESAQRLGARGRARKVDHASDGIHGPGKVLMMSYIHAGVREIRDSSHRSGGDRDGTCYDIDYWDQACGPGDPGSVVDESDPASPRDIAAAATERFLAWAADEAGLDAVTGDQAGGGVVRDDDAGRDVDDRQHGAAV